MRVLFLTPFPLEGPSSRMRVWQYLPTLRALGVDAQALSFVSGRYFRHYYQRGNSPDKLAWLLFSQFMRAAHILRASEFDVIVVQREAAIFGPPLYENWLARVLKKPLVYDFDDAVQHVSPKYGKLGAAVQLIKGPQKTNDLLRLSRAVVAGNRALETYAGGYNKHVTHIPTVVDHRRVCPAPAKKRAAGAPVVLGWMGTHAARPYIENFLPLLHDLAARQSIPFQVRIIGAGVPLRMPGLDIVNRDWSLARELEDLRGFDIGLYPLPDDRWVQGKSGFKAIQNMAVGVPTVASPVGATLDVLQDGVTGYLPTSPAQWLERLEQLIGDPELRARMGQSGRERVEEWYCVERQAPRWKAVLESVSPIK